MHDDEFAIDQSVVRHLVDDQHPQWADLPLVPIASTGTVNAIYRLGADLYVRVPRVARWSNLGREVEWLPRLAPQLTLEVPEPVAVGLPGHGYPHTWAIYRWITGETCDPRRMSDQVRLAHDLATFVRELWGVPLEEGPSSERGPLAAEETGTRVAIAAADGVIDGRRVTGALDEALAVRAWTLPPVWTHGDLLAPNLLLREGVLRAVLDWGFLGLGDPAVDVIPAWAVFDPPGRGAFRTVLGVDDATWARGKGLALAQAVKIIPFYATTNPGLVALAIRTVEQVLLDQAP